MRNDALDRFGTRLDQRFTADQTRKMTVAAGIEKIEISDSLPCRCAAGFKQ